MEYVDQRRPLALSVGDWSLELNAQASPLMAKAHRPCKLTGLKADGTIAIL